MQKLGLPAYCFYWVGTNMNSNQLDFLHYMVVHWFMPQMVLASSGLNDKVLGKEESDTTH